MKAAWVSQSFSMFAPEVEVLVADTNPGDVVLVLLGLNAVVTIPKAEAARVGAEMLAVASEDDKTPTG